MPGQPSGWPDFCQLHRSSQALLVKGQLSESDNEARPSPPSNRRDNSHPAGIHFHFPSQARPGECISLFAPSNVGTTRPRRGFLPQPKEHSSGMLWAFYVGSLKGIFLTGIDTRPGPLHLRGGKPSRCWLRNHDGITRVLYRDCRAAQQPAVPAAYASHTRAPRG